MPTTEKTYPDWVQAFRARGTTVKKKGDAYYLYKRTSKRVPGKKYPQPVDIYIGLITPKGIDEEIFTLTFSDWAFQLINSNGRHLIMKNIYIPHLKWGPRQSRSVT